MTRTEAINAALARHWGDERGMCRCDLCDALRAMLATDGLEGRVANWVRTRLGVDYMNRKERALRVVEEAIELAQSEGVESWRITSLNRHVYARVAGDPTKEAGGVAVTLLAWCAATGHTLADLGLAELERIEAKPLDQIRGSLERKAGADLVCAVPKESA